MLIKLLMIAVLGEGAQQTMSLTEEYVACNAVHSLAESGQELTIKGEKKPLCQLITTAGYSGLVVASCADTAKLIMSVCKKSTTSSYNNLNLKPTQTPIIKH